MGHLMSRSDLSWCQQPWVGLASPQPPLGQETEAEGKCDPAPRDLQGILATASH